MYDHVKKALSRVYWQYKNSPKLLELIKSIPDIAQTNIENQASKIAEIIDIETATGEWLDICGRIVGFTERPTYKLSPVCEVTAVTDDIYRAMIRAKIHKNNSSATIDDVKIAIDYILNADVHVLDGQDMSMRIIWFEDNVPDLLVKILLDYDLLPRPQGVGLKEHRVIDYIPFGFGEHYQNFNNSTFWKGDGFKKYYGDISFNYNADTFILTGTLTANDTAINIVDVDITLIVTKSDGTAETFYLVTDENGQFSHEITESGDFIVYAKAQLQTPLCTTLDIRSKDFSFININYNYYITETTDELLISQDGYYLVTERK